MMIYLILVGMVAITAASARLTARAVREEYLLVLHWREHGLWVFEQKEDGRYGRIPLAAIPLALLRFLQRSWHPRPLRLRLPGSTTAPDAA